MKRFLQIAVWLIISGQTPRNVKQCSQMVKNCNPIPFQLNSVTGHPHFHNSSQLALFIAAGGRKACSLWRSAQVAGSKRESVLAIKPILLTQIEIIQNDSGTSAIYFTELIAGLGSSLRQYPIFIGFVSLSMSILLSLAETCTLPDILNQEVDCLYENSNATFQSYCENENSV